MRFVIRADANAKSGTGHVMRSSVIAEELIRGGYSVVFVGDTSEVPWLEDYIRNLGFTEVVSATESFISNSESDVLILDSYSMPVSAPEISPSKWSKIVAFVDDATPQYHADLYVHTGIKTKWKPPASAQLAIFLYGLEYIQIRNALKSLKLVETRDNKLTPKILVIGGGSDPFGFVSQMYEILKSLEIDFAATLIMNNENQKLGDSRFSVQPFGIHVHKLINHTNLVFTTAGTSSWEFIYLKRRIGLACVAPNQEANYQFQTASGVALGIGHGDYLGGWSLKHEIIYGLITTQKPTNTSTLNIDGYGAERLLQAIIKITAQNF